MEKEKNMVLMAQLNLKENILKDINFMGKVIIIIIKVIQYLKGNILTTNVGMEYFKNIMIMEIYYLKENI